MKSHSLILGAQLYNRSLEPAYLAITEQEGFAVHSLFKVALDVMFGVAIVLITIFEISSISVPGIVTAYIITIPWNRLIYLSRFEKGEKIGSKLYILFDSDVISHLLYFKVIQCFRRKDKFSLPLSRSLYSP